MKRFGLFLAILALAVFGYRFFGPAAFAAILVVGLLAWWVVSSLKNAPDQVWGLVQGLAATGMLFGAVWTAVVFYAVGLWPAVGCLILLYGLFELRRYAGRRIAAAAR